MRNLLIVTSLSCALAGCAASQTSDGVRTPAKTPSNDASVGGAEVAYVIDGRNATRAEFEKLAPEQIAQIEVIRGSAATERYGTIGRNGVISVTTRDSNTRRGGQLTASLPSDVLYFINGSASTRAAVQALAVEAIESIEIIKGKSAVLLYGPEAGAGAILVRLKPTR
jgi:outer membrane receptor protein involved in Fe transport